MKVKLIKCLAGSLIVMALYITSAVPAMAEIKEGRIFPECTGTRAEAAGDRIRLRTYPGEYSDETDYPADRTLYVLGVNHDWYRVRSGDQEGWIQKACLKVSPQAFVPYSRVLGEEVVRYGKQFIGTPYVWGGNDPKKGIDCSGLTQKVFQGFDIQISRTSYNQAEDGRRISKAELRPGDLVFFDTSTAHDGRISHVGLYAGDDLFLHADCTKGVTLTRLSNSYYVRNYVMGSRILKDD